MRILSKKDIKIELEKFDTYSNNDILLDEEDINLILKGKDIVVMSICESSTKLSPDEVIKSIILDFENNDFDLKKADGILICFQTNPNYQIMDFYKMMDIIYYKCETLNIYDEQNILFSMHTDMSYESDYFKATAFISYLEHEKPIIINNLNYTRY